MKFVQRESLDSYKSLLAEMAANCKKWLDAIVQRRFSDMASKDHGRESLDDDDSRLATAIRGVERVKFLR